LERFKLKRLIILIILFSNFAQADQKDERLIELFDKLFLSTNNMEASKLLFNIWDIWSIADNQETQIIFDEANQFMDVGELDNAIELFTKVVKQSPEFAEGWNKRATVYFLKGELNKSISDIEKTLNLEPRHFGALDGLAEIYLMQDDLVGAAVIYRRILEIIPSSKKSQDRLKLINDLLV
jgi:tetratricopeptide (TPR) repeat protein|tara:strand:- start:446 stop:988 length:543 start_codon:yes stop_codon:yes gene_type:complete